MMTSRLAPRWCLFFAFLLCASTIDHAQGDDVRLLEKMLRDLHGDMRPVHVQKRSAGEDYEEKVDFLIRIVRQLARQVMQQQLFVEERIRSDGASGIKHSRLGTQGTKTYHATSYVDNRFASIHEHANNIRVVGMGEFIAVLNGVEFRTRHNDYKLVMPSKTSKDYKATEEIPYPEVPPEVTSYQTPDEQIIEMREWFRAWRDQDYSVRDYRKYFKPVLCYLEGAWTVTDGATIEESFDSDRHFIDASSWHDLQQKIRFTSYTGKKDANENFAYLPTTIMNVGDNGTAGLQMAQWNYRILCHPLSRDLPLNRLRVIDDVKSRMSYKRTLAKHEESRAARFRMAVEDKDKWTERPKRYGLLDELMQEIPGLDNYGAYIEDDSLGVKARKYGSSETLNGAYYNRWFGAVKDAMGASTQHRGYADENLFVALTKQAKVAPLSVNTCKKKRRKTECETSTQRVSYAIPMEIIYMTPLYKWNPYNIEYKGSARSEEAATVTAGGRNGKNTSEQAYDGTHSKLYYHTPTSFFTDPGNSDDQADTSRGAIYVLDKNRNVRHVVASGTRIKFPEISGIGALRTRYPIMPTHQEGSATWKELDALKDLVLNPDSYKYMMYKETEEEHDDGSVTLKTSASSARYGSHVHYVTITRDDVRQLKSGETMRVETTQASGHTHTLTLAWRRQKLMYLSCSDAPISKCWDGHGKRMFVEI